MRQSNNASLWCSQKPLTLQSARRPPSPFLSVSLTIGCFTVWVKPADFTNSIFRSLSSLCLKVTNPPFLQLSAWQTVKLSPSASQIEGKFVGCFPYHRDIASLNWLELIEKPLSFVGTKVNQDEHLEWSFLWIELFWSHGNLCKISCTSWRVWVSFKTCSWFFLAMMSFSYYVKFLDCPVLLLLSTSLLKTAIFQMLLVH